MIIGKIKVPTGRYIEDLTGQKFGRLTVLKLTDKKSDFNKIDVNYILNRIGDKIEQ